MIRNEKLKQFFEQLRDKVTLNAQNIRDAAAATGNVNEILPVVKDFADGIGINVAAELSDLTQAQEAARQEKTIQETAAILAKESGTLATETDPTKRQELLESIAREYATLNKMASRQERNRYATEKDYLQECMNYDPDKDFKPSMLAGLRFPNGTLSYIGARPGGGKSAILVNIAREAITDGRTVFLVNLEMRNKALLTNYTLSLMYANATPEERAELDKINQPMEKYYGLFKQENDTRETFDRLRGEATKERAKVLDKTLFFYDGVGEPLESLIREIESKVKAGDVVLIDYVQNMKPPQGSNEQRYIQIKQISRTLLELALKKNVVVISGAQFGRPEKGKGEKTEYAMGDFREGGDLEQDAHNALGIAVIDNDSRYIYILKQREGGAIKGNRELLDCNFDYLYIAGTGRKYGSEENPEKLPRPTSEKPITQIEGINIQ